MSITTKEEGTIMTQDSDRNDRILNYARERFEQHVEFILDDPSGIDDEDLLAIRQTAADLGIDFDAFIASHGTEYEQQRLQRKFEAIAIQRRFADLHVGSDQ